MRITGGKFARLTLPPHKVRIRPTTDKARQAIMNVLATRIDFENTYLLELFAGTGMFSYECISRGISKVCLVEKNPSMVAFIAAQISRFSPTEYQVIQKEVLTFLSPIAPHPAHLIFADPPYDFPDYARLHARIFSQHYLHPEGILILEHHRKVSLSQLDFFRELRTYGDSAFSFFFRPLHPLMPCL